MSHRRHRLHEFLEKWKFFFERAFQTVVTEKDNLSFFGIFQCSFDAIPGHIHHLIPKNYALFKHYGTWFHPTHSLGVMFY